MAVRRHDERRVRHFVEQHIGIEVVALNLRRVREHQFVRGVSRFEPPIVVSIPDDVVRPAVVDVAVLQRLDEVLRAKSVLELREAAFHSG